MRLIKVFILLSCAGGFTSTTFAQMKVEVGVKSGLNYNTLNLNSTGKLVSTNYNPGFGYHLGGYAMIRVTKFAIQPELVFSSQGQYFTTPYNSNLHTRINYINIPIMIKYYIVGGLHLQAGAQLGLLVGSKGDLIQIANNGNIVGQPIMGQDLKPYVKSTDFAVAFGAGLDLPRGLNIGIRYNIGITDINKNTGDVTFAGGKEPSFSTAYTRNQVVQFSLGYRLRKFGK